VDQSYKTKFVNETDVLIKSFCLEIIVGELSDVANMHVNELP